MVLITRRDAINGRITSRNKILAAIITGVVFPLVAILIMITDPIHLIVKYKLRLATDTIVANILQKEITAARISVYLFNITNADRFMAGDDYKLNVTEVGPFVFQEYRWYEDLEMSEDGAEMAMTPKIRSEFVPEASIAHPKDVTLTLPNVPVFAAASFVSNYPSYLKFAFNAFHAQIGSKALVKIDVHNYLWGYKDPVITICNTLFPGLVPFEKLGLLERLYENESDYRIVVGATQKDRFKIKSLKRSRHIEMGGIKNVEVSEFTFNDTYEGIGYPPMLTPDIPLNIYRLGICKNFNLELIGTRLMEYGGEAYVYTLSNKTFMGGVDPVTHQPYPNGLQDISSCFYNLPLVISKSHFQDADPKLLDRIEGLNPDKNSGVNKFVVDRKVSVPFQTKMSIQLSLIIDDVGFYSQTKMFSNTVIPIVNVKLDQPRMSEGTMSKFYLVYQIAPKIVLCIIVTLFLIGLMSLAYAVRSIHLNWISRTNEIVFESTTDKLHVDFPLMRETDN